MTLRPELWRPRASEDANKGRRHSHTLIKECATPIRNFTDHALLLLVLLSDPTLLPGKEGLLGINWPSSEE